MHEMTIAVSNEQDRRAYRRSNAPHDAQAPNPPSRERSRSQLLVEGLAASAAVIYLFVFIQSVSYYWFQPQYFTDDAFQQTFFFHEVMHPGLFAGDLITEYMRAFLPPLHYALYYGVTWLSGGPIIASHWVMLLQYLVAIVFLGLLIYRYTGFIPTVVGLVWFLHTESIIDRMTGGFPRGWWQAIILSTLYFISRRNHTGVIVVLAIGSLLNPLATVTMGFCYALSFIVRFREQNERKKFAQFLILIPFYALLTYYSVKRPPEVGNMIPYEQALTMPELSRDYGRFRWLPLSSPFRDLEKYTAQVFLSQKKIKANEQLERTVFLATTAILVLLAAASWWRKTPLIPMELYCLLGSAILAYGFARLFAFRLYVPDRYLFFALPMFIIPAFIVGLWRLHSQFPLGRIASYTLLVVLIGFGTNFKVPGRAHFNRKIPPRQSMWGWFATSTERDALVAGHPTIIDGVPLLGMRRAYVTTEAAHPYFDRYYAEIRRRLLISWEAYYARDISEFVNLLRAEGIDYYVFVKGHFAPEKLKRAKYFRPYDTFVRQLASGDPAEYTFSKLTGESALGFKPAIAFEDEQVLVISVNKLSEIITEDS